MSGVRADRGAIAAAGGRSVGFAPAKGSAAAVLAQLAAGRAGLAWRVAARARRRHGLFRDPGA